MKTALCRITLCSILVLALSVTQPLRAQASDIYTSALNDLVASGNTLLVSMSQITLTSFTMLNQLSALESSVTTYQNSVMALYDTMANNTATITLASESLLALQNLATLSASLTSRCFPFRKPSSCWRPSPRSRCWNPP